MKEMNSMKLVLVGAGGYGRRYVDYLLSQDLPGIQLEGIVEKFFETCPSKEKIEKAGVPVYDSLSAFYQEREADLVVIVTPSYLHCEQSIYALQHNSYVLCEKPVAPTVEEAGKMLGAEKQYGKFIAVGYQWSFSEAIQTLKKDILNGKFGKPVTFKTIISWPRKKTYYNRGNGWAGKISKDGIVILDSIASNACAHYIHNMFFLLGEDMESSAFPTFVEAECLRANAIETFDTCIMKMIMNNGAELYFAATHAADRVLEPEFVYEFEHATIEFEAGNKSEIIARFTDGTVINYGNPFSDELKKLRDCAEAVKSGETPMCTVRTALSHTRFINELHKHIVISEFDETVKRLNGELVYVEGLYEKMLECYHTREFLADKGFFATKKFKFNGDCE